MSLWIELEMSTEWGLLIRDLCIFVGDIYVSMVASLYGALLQFQLGIAPHSTNAHDLLCLELLQELKKI